MAKLSPEEKELRRKATKLRNQAWLQRINAFHADIDSAQKEINSGPIGKALGDACKALDDALAKRESEFESIDKQIEALNAKRLDIEREYKKIIDPLAKIRRDCFQKKRDAESAANDAAKARYPDVADCWGAAGWKPIEEFLPMARNEKLSK